jgi:hypothetical protein
MVALPATRLYWSTSTVQRRGPEAFGFSTFSLQEPSEYLSVHGLLRRRGRSAANEAPAAFPRGPSAASATT